ncbi:MAG: DUF4340 domain-containing protein [Candidatus Eisenbacteria bacterium]|uniref:DUF4340 domain-containing protein n=1 Tax=Eiseniibacteriota bacterium TaxID=2212470 RepID=A0A948RWK8_UNCEI|nr:DUF4340 domain-containing protein [Candidatus Eisenbacteria bacterium]MBU1948664.1 DUF4340 domain-containing protein [Candidatus Eisenbacteria bacterium]MBU2690974.1 DUF4340 domain-containing protein [Candidatus Eisenbacteria bacterium]
MQGRNRTVLILAGVLVVLIIIATVSEQSRKKRRNPGGPLYPGFQIETVAGIALEKGETRVELAKNDEGKWLVVTEGNYPADAGKAERIIEPVSKLHTRDLVSRKKDKQDDFEVSDSLGTTVKMTAADGATLAHFIVGKQGPDFMSTYLRPYDDDRVLLVPKYLRTAYDLSQGTFRDKTIFEFGQDEVSRVEILPEEGDSILIVKGANDIWTILEPDSAAVKDAVWKSLLRTASTLKCDAFPETELNPSDAGLAPPREMLRFEMMDGRTETLKIGREEDKGRFYVIKEGNPTIFLLSKGRITTMMKTFEDLIETAPSTPKATPMSPPPQATPITPPSGH